MADFMSPTIGALAQALSKAQAEIKGAVKDSTNPHFRSRYADLASVWDAIRTPLTKNGLSVVQTTTQTPDGLVLSTLLLHSSGEWVRGDYPIVPIKNDPQAWGSALTYARRYNLASVCGVAPEDDDGNAASGRTVNEHVAPASVQKSSAVEEWAANAKAKIATFQSLSELDEWLKKSEKVLIKLQDTDKMLMAQVHTAIKQAETRINPNYIEAA